MAQHAALWRYKAFVCLYTGNLWKWGFFMKAPKNYDNGFITLNGNVVFAKQRAFTENGVCPPLPPLLPEQTKAEAGKKKTRLGCTACTQLFSPLCCPLLSFNLCFCAEPPFKDGILIWPSRVMPWKSCSGFGSCSGMRVEWDFKLSKAILPRLALGYSWVRWFSKAWVE